jgi:hypothetical protein
LPNSTHLARKMYIFCKSIIMKKIYFLLLLIPSFAWAAVFPGNGGTGFGGAVGNGNLAVTDDGSNINFVLTGAGSFSGNDLVIYIDNLTGGGYTSTATFTDNADGGRTAIAGFNAGNPSRALINFPPGFHAQNAISVEYSFAGLFDLTDPTNFTFIASGGLSVVGNTLSFSFNKSMLGITGSVNFNFFATLISTSAYRSNETIGSALTDTPPAGDAPNYGFNGTINPSTYALYPSGVLAVSGLALTGQNHGTQSFLQWTTLSESGLSNFILQQSADAVNWSDAGTAAATNNASGNTYSQLVRNLPGRLNYFRVEVISADGSIAFSRVLVMKTDLRDDIVLINSVAQNELVLQFNSDYNSTIYMRIIDGMGRTLKTAATGSGAGGIVHLDVSGLQNGMYFLDVRTAAGVVKTFRFLKQ